MYVKKYKSSTLKGKLRVAKYLSANKSLKHYVPRTVSFSMRNLRTMAAQYSALYIKPNIGSEGKGIYKLFIANGCPNFTKLEQA